MMNLFTANMIIGIVLLFFAYIIVITLGGFTRAWVANKLGDWTPAQLGFLTLNPLVHIDPIGLALLILFRFGWGRYIPINPHRFYGRFAWLKRIGAFYSEVLTYAVIAILSLLPLIAVFKHHILIVIHDMVNFRIISPLGLAQQHPELSTLSFLLLFFLAAITYMSILLLVLSLIWNSIMLGFYVWVERERYQQVNYWTMVFVPIIVIFLFGGIIQYYSLYFISKLGMILARMIGVL